MVMMMKYASCGPGLELLLIWVPSIGSLLLREDIDKWDYSKRSSPPRRRS